MKIDSFLDSCIAGEVGKTKLLCSCKISMMHGLSQWKVVLFYKNF